MLYEKKSYITEAWNACVGDHIITDNIKEWLEEYINIQDQLFAEWLMERGLLHE